MFGAAERANLVGYSQEQDWGSQGNITKVTLYFDEDHGCLQGVKAIYGGSVSSQIGISRRGGNRGIRARDIRLTDGEVVNSVSYRSGRWEGQLLMLLVLLPVLPLHSVLQLLELQWHLLSNPA